MVPIKIMCLVFLDDGSPPLHNIGWEGHDEGVTSINNKTSAISNTGTFTMITTKKAV